MAGFENSIEYSQGERLEPSLAADILQMQKSSDDVSRINYTGNPEGNVAANPSSLSHDPVSGKVYAKQTGTGNTGWVPLNGIIQYSNSMDFTVGGVYPLFTTVNRPFVLMGYSFYGVDIDTPTVDGFGNLGWTAPDYNDETTDINLGVLFATNENVVTIPPGFGPAVIIPANTTFSLKITTPETAVAYDVIFSIIGFYV